MDYIGNILQTIPLFHPLSEKEITYITQNSNIEKISKDKIIDFKKQKKLIVVIDGLIIVENRLKGDFFYLSRGSFFGDLPFIEKKHASIKTLADSTVLLIETDILYKLLFASYRTLRGFIKNIHRLNIETEQELNSEYTSKVICSYGFGNSGKTVFASYLAFLLSGKGSVIILDASYTGSSSFRLFEKELSQAIAQKLSEKNESDQFISDNIVQVQENISLLNIAHDSKIKVNTDILSPLIIYLSKKFKYIIIDLADDHELKDAVFSLSDYIFPVLKNIKDIAAIRSMFDSGLNDCQRVYFLLNRYFSQDISLFEGGLFLDNLDIQSQDSLLANLRNITKESTNENKTFTDIITSKKTALVVESYTAQSALLSGFFSTLYAQNMNINLIYSSSWSYILCVLYLTSKDQDEFENNFKKYFSQEKIKSFLDISFPENFVFKQTKIQKAAKDIALNVRIETFKTLCTPLVFDTNNRTRRICSTGFVKDLIAASFAVDPVFEPVNIEDKTYSSGYPQTVNIEDIFKTDIDQIMYVSVNNKSKLNFGQGKFLKFYKNYIDMLDTSSHIQNPCIADKTFTLQLDISEYNTDKILADTKQAAESLFKNVRKK